MYGYQIDISVWILSIISFSSRTTTVNETRFHRNSKIFKKVFRWLGWLNLEKIAITHLNELVKKSSNCEQYSSLMMILIIDENWMEVKKLIARMGWYQEPEVIGPFFIPKFSKRFIHEIGMDKQWLVDGVLTFFYKNIILRTLSTFNKIPMYTTKFISSKLFI